MQYDLFIDKPGKKPKEKKDPLSKAYAAANTDEGQREAVKDWGCTISDGLNTDNSWENT